MAGVSGLPRQSAFQGHEAAGQMGVGAPRCPTAIADRSWDRMSSKRKLKDFHRMTDFTGMIRKTKCLVSFEKGVAESIPEKSKGSLQLPLSPNTTQYQPVCRGGIKKEPQTLERHGQGHHVRRAWS